MAAGWVDILQGTVEGDVRDWTCTFSRYYEDTAGAPAEPAALEVECGTLKLAYGDLGRIGRGEPLISSRMTLRVHDPDGSVRAALLADPDERRFLFRITDGAEYYWNGYPRLDTIRRPAHTDIRPPTFDVYVTCGLSSLDDLPARLNYRAPILERVATTLHDITALILHTGLHGLPIEYVMGWLPQNIGAGAAMDLIRFRSYQYEKYWTMRGGGFASIRLRYRRLYKELTQRVLIEEIASTFGARIWQGFTAGAGGTNAWHFEQRHATGELIPLASRAAQRFDGATLAETERPANSRVLTEAEEDGEGMELHRLRQIAGVAITQSFDQAKDPQLLRDGRFEHYDGTWRYFEAAGAVTQKAELIGKAASIPPGGALTARICHLAEGLPVRVALDFGYSLDVFTGGVYAQKCRVQVLIEPFSGADDTYYLSKDLDTVFTISSWTTTPTVLERTGTSGTVSLVTRDPIPVSGMLTIKWLGQDGGSNYNLLVRNARVTLVGEDGQPVKEVSARFDRATSDGKAVRGETVELGRGFADVEDRDVSSIESGLVEVYDGAAWVRPARWTDPSGKAYWDLAELTAQDLIDQADEDTDALVGRVLGIVPPEQVLLRGETQYVVEACEIDLIQEVTEVVALPKLKTIS